MEIFGHLKKHQLVKQDSALWS